MRHSLRTGKSIRLQNRRKQVQNESAYVGGMCVLCMCVRACVRAFVAFCLCAYMLVIESGCISLFEGNFDSLVSLF